MKTLFTLMVVALLIMAWLPFRKIADGAQHLSRREPAIQALMELESAAELGLSYTDYSRCFTDTGVRVKTPINQMGARGADNCLVQAILEMILDSHRRALDAMGDWLKGPSPPKSEFFKTCGWIVKVPF